MLKSIRSRTMHARVLALSLAVAAFAANAADVTGAGASFIYPVMSKWSADYAKATGKKVNYQSIGSGGGIAQAKAGTVDFGSTDAPLKPEELAKSGLIQFPSVIGGVVPVINVPGVASGAMKLDGDTLAKIFLGQITMWNDPAIVAQNGGIQLPAKKITVVHRSDGSGTTFNFVNYLGKVSPTWKQKVGEGTMVQWPVGIGGKGNEGVAAYVKQIPGGIGYVELSYALQNKMAYSRMKNAAGNYVLPSDETFAAAAASADWTNAKDFYLVMTNAPGAQSWPITATTFILMYKQPKNAAGAKNAKDFFRWVYTSGDAQAKALDYVPLPDTLIKQIEQYWSVNAKY
nr:phosphate ABC transporter substrate-binding protein PstS [Lysobacter terrigena]